MNEHLLEQVRALERANRRLKTVVVGLSMALLLLSVVTGFTLFLGYRMVAAWETELQAARQAAEAARSQPKNEVPTAPKQTP